VVAQRISFFILDKPMVKYIIEIGEGDNYPFDGAKENCTSVHVRREIIPSSH
jgi:hypothetical protein